jgi:hypothetical protein
VPISEHCPVLPGPASGQAGMNAAPAHTPLHKSHIHRRLGLRASHPSPRPGAGAAACGELAWPESGPGETMVRDITCIATRERITNHRPGKRM